MQIQKSINIAVFIIGIVLGLFAYPPAETFQPPLKWNHMPFLFFGSFFGVLFVAGIQLIRKNPKYSRTILMFFIPLSILTLGLGAGSFAMSMYYDEISPYSMLYLVIGGGLTIGVGISKMIFNARFPNAL